MILIKANLKLMFRCKSLILIVLCMVIVTGMLSAVFQDIMVNDYEMEDCRVSYAIDENCKYEMLKPVLESIFTENGIDILYDEKSEGKQLIEKGLTDVYVEITDTGCIVYSASGYKNEAGMIKMLLLSIFSQSEGSEGNQYVGECEVEPDPMPDSGLYYTVAYTVYFTWCAMIVLAVILSSERKNCIGLKFKSSPLSPVKFYFGRFIPASIMITLLIGSSVMICTPLYSIEWNSPGMTVLILVLGCIAAATVGTILFGLIKNVMAAVACGFCLNMYWGFFGGAFASYMHASFADGLRETSPIYYMIRSIVELNTMGQSEYTMSAIWVLAGIIVLGIPVGILSVKLGKEGK